MNRAHLREKLYLSGIDSAAAQLARRYALGFEVTAFCMAAALEDSAAVSAAEAETADIARLWLHAPFAELHPCAIDPLVRDIAVKRYRQTIAMARRLGIRRIVIHDGYVPFVYFPEWFVEQSVNFWRAFLPEVPQDMTIALENVMDDGPDMLSQIMKGVNDPRLGVCLDVGHAQHHRQQDAAPGLDCPAVPMAAARPYPQQFRRLGSAQPAGRGQYPHGAGAGRPADPVPRRHLYHRKHELRPVP